MAKLLLSRRAALALTTASALSSLTPRAAGAPGSAHAPVQLGVVPELLGGFIANYLRVMNAPGLTLGLSTRAGGAVTASYGYADLIAKIPVTPVHLFQIGSISKSFVGLVILQLQQEGKLEVQHPILRYLPWLPVAPDYGPISIHHLLTHGSGMPDQAPIFPGEPGGRVRQGFAPGSQFHYSNWGYNVLGRLIEELEGCSWPEAVTRRILSPLGMRDSVAAITSVNREKLAPSYLPLHDDRPYPRRGPLGQAGNVRFTDASGSIASTPRDMTRYMHMLLNRGIGPSGRLITEESFAAFSTGHIAAPAFGPGACYGYGIAVVQFDGHTHLRHTGGMSSFTSSMQLDMDAGVGSFASVNADQGYRPNAVVQYALRLLRSPSEQRSVPMPSPDEWPAAENLPEYVGNYDAPDGRRLEITAAGGQLTLASNGKRLPLQHRGKDEFLADDPQFALFPLLFGRAPPVITPASAGPATAVIDVSYGQDWYSRAGFEGGRPPVPAPELAPYPGTYCPDDVWLLETVRIVERGGRLWVGGTDPLESIGSQRFRLAEEPGNSEILEFRDIIGGRAQVLLSNGLILRRLP